MLLRNHDLAEASATAERIRIAVDDSHLGIDPRLTLSMGVTSNRSFDPSAKSAHRILAEVHKAAFVSKLHGRNKVTVAPLSKQDQDLYDRHLAEGPRFSS